MIVIGVRISPLIVGYVTTFPLLRSDMISRWTEGVTLTWGRINLTFTSAYASLKVLAPSHRMVHTAGALKYISIWIWIRELVGFWDKTLPGKVTASVSFSFHPATEFNCLPKLFLSAHKALLSLWGVALSTMYVGCVFVGVSIVRNIQAVVPGTRIVPSSFQSWFMIVSMNAL